MNKKIDIGNKVEATMNSLEGMQSASPGAFFFTRVKARLDKQERSIWEKVSYVVSRPAVAIIVVLTVILMNAVAVIQKEFNTRSLVEQTDQSAYEDYNVASNTFYDYEISEP